MSRKIIVIHNSGISHEYGLSIACVAVNAEGIVMRVSVAPYERELENVEYVDSELIVRIGDKLRLGREKKER